MARVRVVLIGLAMVGAAGASCAAAGPTGSRVNECLKARPVQCFTPQRFRMAYGITPLLHRGINGHGVRILILDQVAFPGPQTTNIQQDVQQFVSRFHLPPARLRVVSPFDPSASTDLATPEEVLDVETVHTVAPGAAIEVVLVPLRGPFAQWIASFASSLRYAIAHGADVISASYSFGEHCFTPSEVASLHAALRAARRAHVTVVSSSGDYGAVSKECGPDPFQVVREVGYPASDPLVLAAGGTKLTAGAKGRWLREIVWHGHLLPATKAVPAHTDASGGGYSKLFAIPGYQKRTRNIARHRGVPDVAANASSTTGLRLGIAGGGCIPSPGGGPAGICTAQGTSAAAPMWAGIAGLADQYAKHRLGFLNTAIYNTGRGRQYHAALHDITNGNNTVQFPPRTIRGHRAVRDWDAVTGWGSPNASVLVPLLAHTVKPSDGAGL